jgi:hypothetical protein
MVGIDLHVDVGRLWSEDDFIGIAAVLGGGIVRRSLLGIDTGGKTHETDDERDQEPHAKWMPAWHHNGPGPQVGMIA